MIRSGVLWLFLLCLGLCEDGTGDGDEEVGRDLEELEGVVKQAWKKIVDQRLNDREERRFKREVVADWSSKEIARLLGSWTGGSWNEEVSVEKSNLYWYWEGPMGERDAFLDHRRGLEHFRGMNSYHKKVQEVAGRGLDSNAAEGEMGLYYDRLKSTITGWSRRDPRAAWHAVSHPEGELAGLALLDSYGYLLPRTVFEYLAREDPHFAIAEFKNHGDPLYRESMLIGMSRGLPKGFAWEGLIVDVLAELKGSEKWLHRRVRENLFARWMEDDADEAMKWFRSEAGSLVSVEHREDWEGGVIEVEHTVESAWSTWWLRDAEGAELWLRKNPAVLRRLLRGDFEGTDLLYPDDLREILVALRDRVGREKIMDRSRKKGKLPRLLSAEGRETLELELAELDLSPEMANALLEVRLADKSDPFAK